MEIVEKDYDRRLEQRTVVDSPPVDERQSPRAYPVILQVAQAAQSITPWGTNPVQRDRELRSFWHAESWLASVVYSVSIRNASFAWEVTGSDPEKPQPKNTVRAVMNVLKNSNRGKGWQSLITKTCIDLYTQDNGAYWEIIRVKNRPDSPVINLAHLDSAKCWRTGDPQYPVIYRDRFGRERVMRWWEIKTLEEFPSPIEEAFDLQYCLAPDSVVRMADGSSKKIRDLVKSRSENYVLSVDEQGNVVPKRIIGWHENSKGNRKFVNIRGKYVCLVRGNKQTNSWVTEDHPILTPDGWKSAGQLKTGDKIITSAPGVTEDQKQFLVGSIMGDSCVTKASKTPRLSIGHCKAQEEWLDVKFRALENLAPVKYYDKKRQVVHIQTKVQPALHELFDNFYGGGSKVFSIELFKKYLSPRLLATWFMDDGTSQKQYLKKTGETAYYASLGTTGQDIEILNQIVDILSENGYKCSLHKSGYEGKFNIGFTKEGSKKLYQDIAEYVVPCLRYKLPEIDIPYKPESWIIADLSERFVDTVEIKVDSPPRASTVYCIDVEDTHNFLSANIVVHNCAVTRALLAAEIVQSISTYKMEKVSGNFTKAVDVVSGVTQNNIDDAVALAQEQNLNQVLYRYSLPVVVAGVDPTSTLSHVHIDLASLPDNFDEDTSFKWYVAQLAAAFGVDYQEIAPLMTGNLGSSQQSDILHLKTRGKGPALIMGLFEETINRGLIPGNVKFKFLEQDLRTETERAEAKFTRVKARSLQIKSGELDAEAARELAILDGDLPRWLAKDVAARADTQNVEQPEDEFGPRQIEGGIETQFRRITMNDVRRVQKSLRENIPLNIKASIGFPSGTFIAPVYGIEGTNTIRADLMRRFANARARFVPEDAYHISLAYVGLLDDLEGKAVLRDVGKSLPIQASASTVSYFDTPNGKAIILLVDEQQDLKDWQRRVVESLGKSGIVVSEHHRTENWKPHITLAYVDPSVPFEEYAVDPVRFEIESHMALSRDKYEMEW